MKQFLFVLFSFLFTFKLSAISLIDSGFQTRAMGMGNAFSGLSDDSSGLYYNPSLLYDGQRQHVTFGYGHVYTMANSYQVSYSITGLKYPSFISDSQKPSIGLSIGMSVLRDDDIFSYSAVDYGNPGDYNKGKTYNFNENLFMFGFGNRLGNFFSMQWAFGFTFKYYYREMIEFTSKSFGLDLGFTTKHKFFNLSFNIKNLFLNLNHYSGDTKIGKESLPVSLRIGSLLKVQTLYKSIFKPKQIKPTKGQSNFFNENVKFFVNPLFDLEIVFEDKMQYNTFFGLEVWMNNSLALRGGYNNLNGLSFGGSVGLYRFRFDYSLIIHPELENTHRISGSFYF